MVEVRLVGMSIHIVAFIDDKLPRRNCTKAYGAVLHRCDVNTSDLEKIVMEIITSPDIDRISDDELVAKLISVINYRISLKKSPVDINLSKILSSLPKTDIAADATCVAAHLVHKYEFAVNRGGPTTFSMIDPIVATTSVSFKFHQPKNADMTQ